MIIIILLLYVLAAYLAVFKPTYFAILFGIVGNVYDGFGIGKYFNGISHVHYVFFYVLLYVALLSSFVYYFKSKSQMYNKTIALYLLFSLSIFLSIFLYSIVDINGSQSFLSNLMNSLYKMADFSFIVSIILLLNHKRYNVIKMLKYYVSIQVVIATLVIYLPNFGIHILDRISGINYQDILIYSSPVGATVSNFFEVFFNKYYFNKFAHFHNSNDTGFFFGTALFLTLCKLKKSKNKIRYLILSFILFVFWANSGMRAPIVAIIFSFIISTLTSRISIKNLILAIISFTIIVIPFLSSDLFVVFSNFITGANTTSNNPFEGRINYIFEAVEFLKDNYLIGYGTDVERLSSNGVTPHLLPLRIATMSGIFAGFLSAFCVYIQPLLLMIKQKNIEFFTIGVYSILFFVSVTNNYTNIVLFNFLLASLIAKLKPFKKI